MSETRKLAAILCSDVVGYSRLAGADEDRILARLRALRSDLIDPTIAVHHGRVVKRTGDGSIVDFRSVVDAVRCAIEVQNAMVERNAGVPEDRRIVFRIGIHLGDVVEESDGDLMGDGVNIAARLEGVAAPGAICLSEDAYRQVSGRLDMEVTDLGATRLKNIARPIRAYSLQVGMPAVAKPATEAKLPEPKRRSMLAPLVSGIVALIVIAGGGWYFLAGNRPAPVAATAPAPAEAAHLSLVVLPFTNLSGDATQDYFADGVTENLTTDLSRIRNSFVIARNTAFTFKGKNVDAKEIGKELGVRYVLEGSVQRDQGRVRVNAQLIDAETGAHLWADRFEDDVADLFTLQDEVVARLGNSLGNELVKAEARTGARAGNPDAIDLRMRGWSLIALPGAKDNNDAARALFQDALKVDPNDADALAGSAYTYSMDCSSGWTRADVDYEALVLGQADKALRISQNVLSAYYAKADYLLCTERPEDARRAAEAGLSINPNSAPLHASLGRTSIYLGKFAEAETEIRRAIRLSPRDPALGGWRNLICVGELGLEHLDGSIDECRKAIDAGFDNFGPHMNLAAAYAIQGKLDEAKTELVEARRLYPELTVKWVIEHYANIPRRNEGLRKAGLPEE
jgi:adenylate cyclase